MKSIINGFLVSFSMYSIIPIKKDLKWDKNTMKYALCFLPLIGLIIGSLEILWLFLCLKLNIEKTLYACVSVVLPIIVSGGIHLDGLIDTADAFFSYADIEKRIEILKDPHVGAFCVIYYSVFILLEFGFYSQIYVGDKFIGILFFAFILSRAIGGRLIVSLKCAKDSGLAKIFSDNADKKAVEIFLTVLSIVIFMIWIFYYKIFGFVVFISIILFYFMYKKMCCLKFGGITGDLAGCFISLSELLMIMLCCFGGVIF